MSHQKAHLNATTEGRQIPRISQKNILLERTDWCTIPNTKISERKRKKLMACK
jgi:hypothetical protein